LADYASGRVNPQRIAGSNGDWQLFFKSVMQDPDDAGKLEETSAARKQQQLAIKIGVQMQRTFPFSPNQ
jgi:hypothetical protein